MMSNKIAFVSEDQIALMRSAAIEPQDSPEWTDFELAKAWVHFKQKPERMVLYIYLLESRADEQYRLIRKLRHILNKMQNIINISGIVTGESK